jgi:transposase
MRKGIVVDVTTADRARLEAVVANRNSLQKHVWRASIILLTAAGLGTNAIKRGTGRSKSVVWRWQERFMQEGVDGLLRDKTRPPGRKPLDGGVIERVVALTAQDPPGETTHWTAGMMAKAAGISVSSVQRIWQAHGLQPHRVRRFKLSKDPEFVPKLRAIVGLYVNPPAHAIVLSVDEKSQIQALDRTQPGLPIKKGRAGTMTHDYKRHGTTTLLAQCRRDFVLQADAAAAQTRRVPLDCRSSGRHQPLPRRNQCRSQTLRVDRSPRSRHRRRPTRDASVRVGALARPRR